MAFSETRYRRIASPSRFLSFPLRGRVDLVRSGRAFTRETVTRVTSRRAGNLFLTFQFFREPRNSMRSTHGLRVKVVLVLATGPLLSASSASQMLTARRPLPDSKSSRRHFASIANLNINSLLARSPPVYSFRLTKTRYSTCLFNNYLLIVERSTVYKICIDTNSRNLPGCANVEHCIVTMLLFA